MEEEIVRVNQVAISAQRTKDGERKFALFFYPDHYNDGSVLAIQHLLTERVLRDMAEAFQKAVEYIDQS